MSKVWGMIKEKFSTAELSIKVGDSIFLAAKIEDIDITQREARNMAMHVIADIKAGRI